MQPRTLIYPQIKHTLIRIRSETIKRINTKTTSELTVRLFGFSDGDAARSNQCFAFHMRERERERERSPFQKIAVRLRPKPPDVKTHLKENLYSGYQSLSLVECFAADTDSLALGLDTLNEDTTRRLEQCGNWINGFI